jgi:plasmid maintenance system antidote protein VapI
MSISAAKILYPHTQDYITLMPPGSVIAEKMQEMGIDSVELALRCDLPEETIRMLINTEISLTAEVAAKIENATWMPASFLLRIEDHYRRDLVLAAEHPELPVY